MDRTTTPRVRYMVNDLDHAIARLHFRNDIVSGPGGSEVILDDPSGNPVELFQAAQ